MSCHLNLENHMQKNIYVKNINEINVGTLKSMTANIVACVLSERKSDEVNSLSRLQLVVVQHLHSCYLWHTKNVLFYKAIVMLFKKKKKILLEQ